MKWKFEESKLQLDLALDKIRFMGRLRRNRQVSIPKFILDQLEEKLGGIAVGANGRQMNCHIIFDIKAISLDSIIWYRVEPTGKDKSEELYSDASKEDAKGNGY